MSTRVFFLNSNVAQYGEEELNSIQKFLFGQGILNTVGSSWEDWVANGDLKVSQRGAGANMSVDVSAGWGLLSTTRNAITFKVFCQAIGVTNLVVSANALGTNRVDAVIMRVSRSAVPNVTTNNVVTLEVITGTGVSALSDGAITTAIGNDDFIRLANITVSNGDTDITTGQIADTRVRTKTNNVFSLNPEVIEMKVLAGDPTNLVEGMLWYNTATDTLNFYNGTAVKSLGGATSYLTDDDTTINGDDQRQLIRNAGQVVGEANATTKSNKIYQSFLANKTYISAIKLYKLANTGTYTGNVTIDLYIDSAGSPSGSSLATITISNAVYNALPIGEFTATFSAPYTATIGLTYWIGISSSTSDNSNCINLGTNSAGGYANGSVKRWNTTDGYIAIATIDLYFRVFGTLSSKVVRYNPSGNIEQTLKVTNTTGFEVAGRFTSTILGGGGQTSMTYNTTGGKFHHGYTYTASSLGLTWELTGKPSILYVGDPLFTTRVTMTTVNISAFGLYFGLGNPTVAVAGHTFTVGHAGFKIIKSGGVISLYATQADGTTENASSVLTTLVAGDDLELIMKINGTYSIDYYFRLNGGALSPATNLTANMPSGTSQSAQFSFSSHNTDDNSFEITVKNASYER